MVASTRGGEPSEPLRFIRCKVSVRLDHVVKFRVLETRIWKPAFGNPHLETRIWKSGLLLQIATDK